MGRGDLFLLSLDGVITPLLVTLSLLKELMLLDRALQYQPDMIIWLTTLESFPNDNLTVVVLLNTEGGPALSLAAAISRLSLGLPAEVNLRDL